MTDDDFQKFLNPVHDRYTDLATLVEDLDFRLAVVIDRVNTPKFKEGSGVMMTTVYKNNNKECLFIVSEDMTPDMIDSILTSVSKYMVEMDEDQQDVIWRMDEDTGEDDETSY